MHFLRMYGIGEEHILNKGCSTDAIVIKVQRCWWIKIKTKAVRLYSSSENTAYPHIITFSYRVDGMTYEGKRFINIQYRVPQPGETVCVYYDPQKPEDYACYAFGPGITKIDW